MSIIAKVESALLRLPLVPDEVACLQDPLRFEEAVAMLTDLRHRHGVRLPLPEGVPLGGPFSTLAAARGYAEDKSTGHLVVAIDEMATDESRSTGTGNEFYATGFDGAEAAVALAENSHWVALWARGVEQAPG